MGHKKKWYKSKVFVITGAGGDIGSEVCRVFATLGMRMYPLDIPGVDLSSLAEELRELGAEEVTPMEMDVTNQQQVKEVIKRIGEREKYIDILHNNAGVGSMCSITNKGTFEEYRRIMSINVDGMWLVLQAALPYIGRPAPTKRNPNRREGQLIFTSSSAGKTGIPNMGAYTASKHAIVGLADALRREFMMADQDIEVITLCPAPTKTQFWDKDEAAKEWVEEYGEKGFLYKLLEPEKVAKTTLKASKKYRKDAFVPRWFALIPFLQILSHKMIAKLLIKIEESKKEIYDKQNTN
ncbi:MAG: SDR family oxidoreductase [Promethearchaeota archaeon]|nr:MAG: SDR family oxidoreductase [Candidatus Lokiarchaeota archaeon]